MTTDDAVGEVSPEEMDSLRRACTRLPELARVAPPGRLPRGDPHRTPLRTSTARAVTVGELEREVASMLGKPSAAFLPSGTCRTAGSHFASTPTAGVAGPPGVRPDLRVLDHFDRHAGGNTSACTDSAAADRSGMPRARSRWMTSGPSPSHRRRCCSSFPCGRSEGSSLPGTSWWPRRSGPEPGRGRPHGRRPAVGVRVVLRPLARRESPSPSTRCTCRSTSSSAGWPAPAWRTGGRRGGGSGPWDGTAARGRPAARLEAGTCNGLGTQVPALGPSALQHEARAQLGHRHRERDHAGSLRDDVAIFITGTWGGLYDHDRPARARR